MHSYILHILKRFRKAVQSYMLMLYAKHGSTARQLDSSTARQLGQTSTDLDSYSTPRRMQSASTGSTATRQLLDSYLTGSTSKALRTAPRQRLDGCSGGALPLETAARTGVRTRPWLRARAQPGLRSSSGSAMCG